MANPFIQLMSSRPPGTTPYVAQMLLPFESGNNGDTIDAAYMAANDIHVTLPVGASWNTENSAVTVSTAQTHALTTPVTVNGTTYDTVGGTRCLEAPNVNIGAVYLQFTDDPNPYDVTIACWFKNTLPQPDGLNQTYDFLSLGNRFETTTNFAVMQSQNWQMRAHSQTGIGSNIAWNRDTWYWVVLKNKQNSATRGSYLWMYNEDGSLLGTSFVAHNAANTTQGTRFMNIGQMRDNAGTGSAFFDNCVLLWETGEVTAPVGP